MHLPFAGLVEYYDFLIDVVLHSRSVKYKDSSICFTSGLLDSPYIEGDGLIAIEYGSSAGHNDFAIRTEGPLTGTKTREGLRSPGVKDTLTGPFTEDLV